MYWSKRMFAVIIVGVLVSISLRFWQIDKLPTVIFDEYHYIPAAKVLMGLMPHPGLEAWRGRSNEIAESPDPNFSHPPLGKLIMGVGILAFGDGPLGWRFFSAVFGIFSLVLLWLISVEFIKDRNFALVPPALMSFEFLHMTQSRVGMLDIFLMTFCLLGMYAFFRLRAGGHRLLWTWVGAVGFFCAISTKMTGFFGLFGFCVLYLLYMPQLAVRIRLSHIVRFVGLVLLLYCSWWVFFYSRHGYSFADWINFNLDTGFRVISKLDAHTYESSPFTWIYNWRPVYYAYKSPRTLIALGHPVLWLSFFSLLIWYVWKVLQKQSDSRLTILLIWFATSYLPYYIILWERGNGFLYYMLQVVPIMCLFVGCYLQSQSKKLMGTYLAVYLAVFIFFFPVVAGVSANHRWIDLLREITMIGR